MKRLVWFLAMLGLTASVVSAGPNAGGVLWVHDTGITQTSDTIVWPADPAAASDCPVTSVDNEMPSWDGVNPAEAVSRYWKVYAAFPAGSSPRLKSVAWGTEFVTADESAYSYVNVIGGDRVNGETATTVFFIGADGFPTADGGTIGQSFPASPGSTGARLTLVTPLFMFWGYGYNKDAGTYPGPTWTLVPKPGDDNFGDDTVGEPLTDTITGYGSLGFGRPGTTPCPAPDPNTLAACCDYEGFICTMTRQADCLSPSVWHGDWYVCMPNSCPVPTGACCLGWGDCQVYTQQLCRRAGGVYRGHDVPCVPDPCPPTGACCLPSGMCRLWTQDFCALNPPGVWHSEWYSCGPNPCPQPPTGACCNVLDGTCAMTTQAACHTPSIWQGAGVPCEPNPCPATPVLLESWAALSLAEGLQLRWEMPLGTTGALYRAWRDPAASSHDIVPTPDAVLVSPAWIGASAEGIIEINDPGAPRGTTVRYFLEMSAHGTRSEFLGPVEARWDPPALVWSVSPTPFRGSVRLTPPGAGPAHAEIFDPAGRLVRALVRTAGGAPLEWDGRDDGGREAPTGIYLVRLTSASGNAVKRLVKIQ